LEVAADNQEVDAWPIFNFAGLFDRGVDRVEGAVAAAFDGEAYAVFFFEGDVGRHGFWCVGALTSQGTRVVGRGHIVGRLY
jgi:hypothetical protein